MNKNSLLREIYDWKSVEIIEANACADHINMLIRIPLKIRVTSFVGYLK